MANVDDLRHPGALFCSWCSNRRVNAAGGALVCRTCDTLPDTIPVRRPAPTETQESP